MAKNPGVLAKISTSARRWAGEFILPSKEIDPSDAFLYGAGVTNVASLLRSGNRSAKTREAIYDKWSQMEADAIVSTAIMLLVTSALGGHETNGKLVFVEKTPAAKDNKRLSLISDDIAAHIEPLLNRIAFQSAYTGAIFGDAYARIYADKRGVVDLYTDEMVRPNLVQPFEIGSRTVGYAVYTGKSNFERLDASQMARLKMPRTQWIPQHGVVEKSFKIALTENNTDKLPMMPSMAGGSLLYNAEEAYDNMAASLTGIVGQRWLDSIDEQMLFINMDAMSQEHQERTKASYVEMLKRSKTVAENAVKSGRPVLERIRHLIPVNGEKQTVTVVNGNGGASGRSSSITIEDVLLHARLLAGAIGVDMSMLGFADQLSGGLGEGGFFRMSAQAAERSRILRVALSGFFNQIIDVHTLNRYGFVFEENERPWNINFFGSISALESEKQSTRANAMNSGMLLVQSMQMFKELGASKELMQMFLEKQMMVDAEEAEKYAEIVEAQPSDAGMEEEAP